MNMTTEQINEMDILSNVKNILEKYKRMQSIQERYIDNSKLLRNKVTSLRIMCNEIEAIANDIDPVASIQTATTRGDRANYEPIRQELLNMLQKGVFVTEKLLSKTFPQLSANQVTYMFSMWLPSVKTLKSTKNEEGYKCFYWDNTHNPTFDSLIGDKA
jgi:hypothetical protein